jgi:hypothetical protein
VPPYARRPGLTVWTYAVIPLIRVVIKMMCQSSGSLLSPSPASSKPFVPLACEYCHFKVPMTPCSNIFRQKNMQHLFFKIRRSNTLYTVVEDEEKPLNGRSRQDHDDLTQHQAQQVVAITTELAKARRLLLILWGVVIFAAVLLCCVTALCVRLSLNDTRTQAGASSSGIETCGTSVTEALSLGCTVDLLSRSWLPQGCSRFGSEEFETEILSWDNYTANGWGWGIFADGAASRALSLEELGRYAETGQKWFELQRPHLLHCAWLLKRVADVFANGGRVDTVSRMFLHTGHCIDTLYENAIKAEDLDVVALRGNIRFGKC